MEQAPVLMAVQVDESRRPPSAREHIGTYGQCGVDVRHAEHNFCTFHIPSLGRQQQRLNEQITRHV